MAELYFATTIMWAFWKKDPSAVSSSSLRMTHLVRGWASDAVLHFVTGSNFKILQSFAWACRWLFFWISPRVNPSLSLLTWFWLKLEGYTSLCFTSLRCVYFLHLTCCSVHYWPHSWLSFSNYKKKNWAFIRKSTTSSYSRRIRCSGCPSWIFLSAPAGPSLSLLGSGCSETGGSNRWAPVGGSTWWTGVRKKHSNTINTAQGHTGATSCLHLGSKKHWHVNLRKDKT